MGIDNAAILVYGWVFSYEEFNAKVRKILHSVGIDTDTDCFELLDLFEEWLEDTYPYFCAGRASPYYDCCWTECEYFLSFEGIGGTEGTDKLYELMLTNHRIKEGDKSDYELVNLMEIEDNPAVFALVHVD